MQGLSLRGMKVPWGQWLWYLQMGFLGHLPQGTGVLSTVGRGRELTESCHCRPSLLNWSDKRVT